MPEQEVRMSAGQFVKFARSKGINIRRITKKGVVFSTYDGLTTTSPNNGRIYPKEIMATVPMSHWGTPTATNPPQLINQAITGEADTPSHRRIKVKTFKDLDDIRGKNNWCVKKYGTNGSVTNLTEAIQNNSVIDGIRIIRHYVNIGLVQSRDYVQSRMPTWRIVGTK